MIVIESKRRSEATLNRLYPGATIIDVTSHASGDYVKFSPFYPHGGIPVPFSGSLTSMSVEGIWQGLKVFNSSDVCTDSFRNATMKDLKRTVRTNGPCRGHRKGVRGTELLGYLTARKLIYLPSYKWVLDHKLGYLIDRLRTLSATGTLVLLDYETNADVLDASKPLSHASLIKAYIEGTYPVYDEASGELVDAAAGSVAASGASSDAVAANPNGGASSVGADLGVTAPSAGAATLEAFSKGDKVRHAKFGEGKVTAVMPEEGRVTVDFGPLGQKTLALRLAKLEKI